MGDIESFDFARARGLVWVCDVQGSSRYLNSDESVGALEAFLPRLYWISSIMVEEAGGTFVKWTGDGFLAWFETPLHRDMAACARAVFDAIQHLTLILNVTQLGTAPQRKFRVRHGVTYEQDALVTRILHSDGHRDLDIAGRAVVLAFRLSGIPAPFPSVLTQREVVEACRTEGYLPIHFRRWTPRAEDRLRYFKKERWGTTALYASCEGPRRKASLATVLKQGEEAIAKAEATGEDAHHGFSFAQRILARLTAGPCWCRDVIDEYLRFVRDDLMGSLRDAMDGLRSMKGERQMREPGRGNQSG
jgi:class 3 adenylate cyclase